MRPLAVVAHLDLAHSRGDRAWTDVLAANGAVDAHVLRDNLTDGRIDAPNEQALLAAHDRIILHDWLDGVLEHGWAYGPGGHALEGKELGIAV